jgi:hypothetical protein
MKNMAKLNKPVKQEPIFTHEGARAVRINAYQMLRRSVCSCMLWEREFYEDGETIADRIASLIKEVEPNKVAELAVEAREKFKLRHVPLLLVRELARLGYKETAMTLGRVIQRPDELSEFLALYWKNGKAPLSAQVKKGLAAAFTKFSSYQLAKYNRDAAIKLRDVLFLSHAKPNDEAQAEVWKKLIDGTLEAPDTWEVSLSAGKDKKSTWERLLSENKLGALALLRNLRNMRDAGVGEPSVIEAIRRAKVERVMPYRFIAAARYAPSLEPYLEESMFKCTSGAEKMKGHTVALIDVSGSMNDLLSAKSDLTRMDAACGVAMILREICDRITVVTFSEKAVVVPSRRGFALRDAITGSQIHSYTRLGAALNDIYATHSGAERIVVVTDEQSHDTVPDPRGTAGYMINVASARNGVGYRAWNHVDGFSEAVIDWIREHENLR